MEFHLQPERFGKQLLKVQWRIEAVHKSDPFHERVPHWKFWHIHECQQISSEPQKGSPVSL
jgi:hypothetical protein